MAMEAGPSAILIITADDYGLWPSYNRGILEAARRGAVDAVSAMVERAHCAPGPLRETGVEVGLHVDFEGRWGARSGAAARSALAIQLDRFSRLFQSWPAYLDGHHHCHARPELATPVAKAAAQLGIAVRSVGEQHRRLLWDRGIPTQDHLIGRLRSGDPQPEAELRTLPAGVTEWIVHPGYRDPASGSSYDAAREEDLNLLLRLNLREGAGGAIWGEARRATHAEALYPPRAEEERSR
jgi:chitin disaccharide deacetylase